MSRRGHAYFLVSDLCLRVLLGIPEYNVNKTKTRPKPQKQGLSVKNHRRWFKVKSFEYFSRGLGETSLGLR